MTDRPFTAAEFHQAAGKQLSEAASTILSEARIDWSIVAPFLDAARAVCRSDLLDGGRIEVHGLQNMDGGLADSEEAYLALAVADRVSGTEWLSATYWLSDLALAGGDVGRVRGTVRALHRTIAKLNEWLEAQPDQAPS